MDRLNVHRSQRVLKFAKSNGFRIVFNASYSPDYNPIERVFALAKRQIKARRLKAILKDEKPDDDAIIDEEFSKICKLKVDNFIKHSVKLLKDYN